MLADNEGASGEEEAMAVLNGCGRMQIWESQGGNPEPEADPEQAIRLERMKGTPLTQVQSNRAGCGAQLPTSQECSHLLY